MAMGLFWVEVNLVSFGEGAQRLYGGAAVVDGGAFLVWICFELCTVVWRFWVVWRMF